MKQIILLIMGLLLVLLSACTPMVYGVPQPTWERMSEPERIEAKDIYRQRQIARQRAAAERDRQRAIYREEQRRQQAIIAEKMRYRVEAIYRGEGNYGDLLRVRIENGMANFHGQVRQYSPVSFQIANGETKEILIATTKRRTVILTAYYDGATLYLDGNKNTRKSQMSRLHYDKRWSRGLTYANTYTNNKAKLKGAEITVEIVGAQRYRNHDRHQRSGGTTIIINEQPTTRVIIRDNARHESTYQRERHEQLKKERRAIEKQRKALKREQAKFEAEQKALKKERAALAKKRARIKELKKESERAKRRAVQEKRETVREREQTVKKMEKELQEQTKQIEKEEKKIEKKKQKVKQEQKKIDQEQKKVEQEEEKLENEKKEKKVN
jgi:uncharacterized phage infection (PIP) family protein YhgE